MVLISIVLAVEAFLCAIAYFGARRRGLAAGLAHLLVLDFGWLAGILARQARLHVVIGEALAAGSAEEGFQPCIDMLSRLGWPYGATTCVFLGTRTQQLALSYSDPHWWWGGVSGVVLIALPAILLFWIGLWGLAALGCLLPLNNASDRWKAIRCLVGFVIGRNRPYYMAREPIIADGQLARTFDGKIVPSLLGPGVVVVNSHYAVPLSDGPGFTRVGASRVILTQRKERPVQVVDLRPHIRLCPVRCMTGDGIEIELMLFLVFKIDPLATDAPENNPHQRLYPFSEEAVFAAIRAQKSDRDQTRLWDDFILDVTGGIACDVFAQHRFDEIHGTAGRDAVRKAIQDKVSQAVGQPGTPGWRGIKLMFIGLSNIEASAQVADWRIEEWRAPKAALAAGEKALGEIKATEVMGRARAQAESALLRMLVDQLAGAQSMGLEQATNTILLRAIETTESMLAQLPPSEQEDSMSVLSTIRRRVRRFE